MIKDDDPFAAERRTKVGPELATSPVPLHRFAEDSVAVLEDDHETYELHVPAEGFQTPCAGKTMIKSPSPIEGNG